MGGDVSDYINDAIIKAQTWFVGVVSSFSQWFNPSFFYSNGAPGGSNGVSEKVSNIEDEVSSSSVGLSFIQKLGVGFKACCRFVSFGHLFPNADGQPGNTTNIHADMSNIINEHATLPSIIDNNDNDNDNDIKLEQIEVQQSNQNSSHERELPVNNNVYQLIQIQVDQAITNLKTALSNAQEIIIKNHESNKESKIDEYMWYYQKPDSADDSPLKLKGFCKEAEVNKDGDWISHIAHQCRCLQRVVALQKGKKYHPSDDDVDRVRYFLDEWSSYDNKMHPFKYVKDNYSFIAEEIAKHDQNETINAIHEELETFVSLRWKKREVLALEKSNKVTVDDKFKMINGINSIIGLTPELKKGRVHPSNKMKGINLIDLSNRIKEKVNSIAVGNANKSDTGVLNEAQVQNAVQRVTSNSINNNNSILPLKQTMDNQNYASRLAEDKDVRYNNSMLQQYNNNQSVVIPNNNNDNNNDRNNIPHLTLPPPQ